MIRVSVIGFGKVSRSLCAALLTADGVQLVQIFNRSKVKNTDFNADLFVHNLNELQEVDVVLISVPDRFILELANQIPFESAIVAHTAGSLGIEVIPEKFNRAVFYPLQTFSENKRVDFTNLPVFIEAEKETSLKILKELADSLHSKVIQVDADQRKALHVAAVFACNFSNHMYKLANDICEKHQLPFEVLLPLIEETAQKIKYLSPENAQTGPAIRHDETTINKHLAFLEEEDKKHIYSLLTQSIQNG